MYPERFRRPHPLVPPLLKERGKIRERTGMFIVEKPSI